MVSSATEAGNRVLNVLSFTHQQQCCTRALPTPAQALALENTQRFIDYQL